MLTIVDIVLEASPNSLELMRQRVEALVNKEDPKSNGGPFFPRLQQIPQLHFMSMQIFEDAHFDPLLVFENNFDGDPDTYWESVLAQLSDDLRAIFACTKQAKKPEWALLFLPGKTDSLVPFLKAHSCRPSAQHFGAVANSLPRIRRDREIFSDIQLELGISGSKYRELDAAGVHAALHKWALQKYKCFNQSGTSITDQAIKAYKWSTLRPLAPWLVAVILAIALTLASHVLHKCGILPWRGMPGIGLALYSFARFIISFIVGIVLMLFLLALTFFLASIGPFKVLRRLEETDLTQDQPKLSPDQVKLFASQEDQIVQNHLASIVPVKSGILRGFLIRTVLRLLRFAVPIAASNGYLGSMRTIHFAHWTLVGNSGRLLFLSNFDGSWQSYLDDFIDKAARGLTLAWGNCVGFPRTQYLVLEGATHGSEFKAWARLNQTQNILWYSAYPDLTVNQIMRNSRIVDGLGKTSMGEKEAEQWARLL